MVDTQQPLTKVLVLDTNPVRAEELSCRLRYLNYEPLVADGSQDFSSLSNEILAAVCDRRIREKKKSAERKSR